MIKCQKQAVMLGKGQVSPSSWDTVKGRSHRILFELYTLTIYIHFLTRYEVGTIVRPILYMIKLSLKEFRKTSQFTVSKP